MNIKDLSQFLPHITAFGFIIGAILGSLAKALAERSLGNGSFLTRSACRSCKVNLNWLDLVPLLSYVLTRGKCRYCRKKIGFEYPLLELITGLVIALIFWQTFSLAGNAEGQYGTALIIFDLISKIFFVVILIIVALTDLKKTIIPDRVILPAIVTVFVSLLAITIYKIIYLYLFLKGARVGEMLLPPYSTFFYRHAYIAAEPLLGSLAMALAIGGFFWLLIILTRGKGMGGGDVKLGAFMGLGLGFPNALTALILSFLSGAIFALGLILLKKKRFGQTIPFGPFLVLGSLIAFFWGAPILEWYLGLSFRY